MPRRRAADDREPDRRDYERRRGDGSRDREWRDAPRSRRDGRSGSRHASPAGSQQPRRTPREERVAGGECAGTTAACLLTHMYLGP